MIETPNYQKRESLISYGLRFIGDPYEWGGDGRKGKGFDCSGLIQEILHSVGALPDRQDRTAQAIYELFKRKSGKPACAHGNLVFFGKDLKNITHIGLTVNEFQYLEAGGGGQHTDAGMVRLRPKFYRKDLVAEIDFLA